MKKLLRFFAAIFLIAFVLLLANCGNDHHALVATDQFAFVQAAPGPGIAPFAMREIQRAHGQRFHRSHASRAGIKPMAVEIANGTDSVVLMKNDGTGESVVANQAGWFEAVHLGYDGKRGTAIAEDLNGYYQVYYVDLTDTANPIARQLTSDTEDHWSAQLSWDGSKVAFSKYPGTSIHDQLVVMPTSGGTESVIATDFCVSYATFTPDGKIVFEDDDTDTIKIMNADGSGVTDITVEDSAHGDWAPSVSPDGKTVALSRMGDIYTVSVSGGTLTQLTTDGESWDPMFVNNRIVYVGYPAGATSYEIFSMKPDATDKKQLTNNSVDEWFDNW